MGYDLSVSLRVDYDERYDKICSALGLKFSEFFLTKLFELSDITFDMNMENEHMFYASPGENVRWDQDEYEQCFAKLSEMFPACRIEFSVNGEESDDYRELVAKNDAFAQSYGDVVYWQRESEKKVLKALEDYPGEPSVTIFLT